MHQYEPQKKQRHAVLQRLRLAIFARECERQKKEIHQLEYILACLPESIIACDREGSIFWLNDNALKLFELSSQDACQKKNFQQFLASYRSNSIQLPSLFPETLLTLQMPSRRQVVVRVCDSPLSDMQGQQKGTLYVLCEVSSKDLKAIQLHYAHETILTLVQSISHLPQHFPEPIESPLLAGSLLLAPPVIYIAQQLVTVIRTIMHVPLVCLKAVGLDGYTYFIAGSGFSVEQDHTERSTSGCLTYEASFTPTQVKHITAREECIIEGNEVSMPSSFGYDPSRKILIVPLFEEEHPTGLLCIMKEGQNSTYTLEEIEFVKAVASQVSFLMQCLYVAYKHTEQHIKNQALSDIQRFCQEFFVLASHELRTPLTSILGNLQLAQRRLTSLQRQLAHYPDPLHHHLVQAQRPLHAASQSAHLQQRMINDMIDDARFQAGQYDLDLQCSDLLALLRIVLSQQQQAVPNHSLILDTKDVPQHVFVLFDTERITRVLHTYLDNALTFSPANQPVHITMRIKGENVWVWVHNEGPGIPPEEQEHLWDRFYRAKGYTVQHELDLSLGLRLYLCRVCIEHHGGQVGVQSDPDHGATFWLTLPMALMTVSHDTTTT